MAKFFGKIGYSNTVDDPTRPGISIEEIIEKTHSGDIRKNFNKWVEGDDLNPDITISNKVSIVANSFSIDNLHKMRYIILKTGIWEITSAEIIRPRIILNIGGVYNGLLPEPT